MGKGLKTNPHLVRIQVPHLVTQPPPPPPPQQVRMKIPLKKGLKTNPHLVRIRATINALVLDGKRIAIHMKRHCKKTCNICDSPGSTSDSIEEGSEDKSTP